MPWKTTNIMELRMQLVRRSLQPGVNFRALCGEMVISPKPGYKWQQRFMEEGKAGLADCSRRAHTATCGRWTLRAGGESATASAASRSRCGMPAADTCLAPAR